MTLLRTLAAAILALAAAAAPGAVHDRGGGLLYDDVLDVTWLQDANYARTCGRSPDGLMSFQDANAWLAGLVYRDEVRGADLRGWRLPRVQPVGSDGFNHAFRTNGTADEGYNIFSPRSELPFMYYVNLGLKGWYLMNGEHPKAMGVLGRLSATWSGQADLGLVRNLQSNIYWTSSAERAPAAVKDAWIFVTAEGNQRDGLTQPNAAFVWPVRPGDVMAPARKP